MEEIIQKITDIGVPFIFNLVAAIIIYLVGKWVANTAAKLVKKLMEAAKTDKALVGFTANLVKYAILIFTIMAAIGRLGVQTTSFIAVLGAAGLAVGMALQGTLSNFAAGVMILLFRPFKIGDFIDAGGTMGSVKEIQIFNTILASPDNRKIIVPNSQITGGIITNFSAIEQRRVDMIFSVSYDDDLKVAKQVLTDLVSADERILKDPAPVIAVSELGDSSVNIICRPWVKPADYWAVYWAMQENGKAELEKAGCTIPFPQRDVHVIKQAEDALQSA
ncbi:MAG: mechanosensitive ion channel [Candidatus Omnitrophica bacterium]|nr:mechanosensitive ion channel [Candidatus Omnitrophota bacterium]MCB9721031.1 mechanosensitive ion channel [Candidatus Omnitrophota bacterium]